MIDAADEMITTMTSSWEVSDVHLYHEASLQLHWDLNSGESSNVRSGRSKFSQRHHGPESEKL